MSFLVTRCPFLQEPGVPSLGQGWYNRGWLTLPRHADPPVTRADATGTSFAGWMVQRTPATHDASGPNAWHAGHARVLIRISARRASEHVLLALRTPQHTPEPMYSLLLLNL